jgi:pilus assembly protein CpaE
MTKTLILAGQDEFVARVNVLPGTQVLALNQQEVESGQSQLLRSLDPNTLPDLMFLCEGLDLEVALDIAEQIDALYPSIDVVLVGEHDPDVIVRAMRSGVRDVIPEHATDSRLVEVLRRAERHKHVAQVADLRVLDQAPPEVSRVVTIISPKGGVGKTSIATNLAIGLAAKYPMDVVLVDLDLQFGDVASTLDISPVSTMEDALGPVAAQDNLALKTMLTVHPANLYVLPGAESPDANEGAADAQIWRLIEQLSSLFRYVVIDTPAGLDEPTLAALELTDDAILVSTMDVSCVRGVRKEAELLTELGLLPLSRMLALNFADRQSGMKVKDVEAVVGLPVDVVIPRSSDVQLAANQGQPLMLQKKRRGRAPFVKSVLTIIEHLEQAPAPTESKHKRLGVA